MTARPIRVLIAEDHAVVREGTRQVLERDPLIETVGEAEDGRQAVSLAAELQTGRGPARPAATALERVSRR